MRVLSFADHFQTTAIRTASAVRSVGIEQAAPYPQNLPNEIPTFSFLSKDEGDFVNDYFLMVGKGDSASQSAYFTSVKGTLGEYKRKSAEECTKYGDLYLKLGFLCGLMILVIII